MQKYIVGTLCATLVACTSNAPVVTKPTSAQPKPQILIRETYSLDQASGGQARIRLYGQNQAPTLMWHGIDCANKPRGTKVNVGGGMGDAFKSFIGTAKSESIGIPATEISQKIGQRNGILSTAFFRELAIEAGKPVNVQAAYLGLGTQYETPTHMITMNEGSCTSEIASFVPQAGHDYEVVGTTGKNCGVAVYEVAQSGRLSPVSLNNRYVCSR